MSDVTSCDKKMAKVCVNCKVCQAARKNQSGVAYWFVKEIEDSLCPFCKAYAKVYGRKAHEPLK